MSVFKRITLALFAFVTIVSNAKQIFGAIDHANNQSQTSNRSPSNGGSGG